MEIRAEDGWQPCWLPGNGDKYRDHLVEFGMKEWPCSITAYFTDLANPNTDGLYWRHATSQSAPDKSWVFTRGRWFPYATDNCPAGRVVVEFMRVEWNEPKRCAWDDLPSDVDRNGLYWRHIDEPEQKMPEDVTSVEPSSANTGSAAQKHRIVQAWLTENGGLCVLGSDGRIFVRLAKSAHWTQISTYPPGLEP